MAQRYALASLDEARAYLAHPVWGERLRECTRLALGAGDDAHALFGTPDDLKFRSSLTLFRHAAPAEPLFADALQHFFDGEPDPSTEAMLRAG